MLTPEEVVVGAIQITVVCPEGHLMAQAVVADIDGAIAALNTFRTAVAEIATEVISERVADSLVDEVGAFLREL